MADQGNQDISAAERGQSSFNITSPEIGTPPSTTEPSSLTRTQSIDNSEKQLVPIAAPSPQERWTWEKFLAHFTPASRARVGHRAAIVRPVHGGTRGYPELGAFLDSDENFMLYRRFGFVQSRLLLDKQERLRRLEEELDALDIAQTSEEGCDHDLCMLDELDDEKQAKRDELMVKLERGFMEYTNLLQAAQAIVAMKKPSAAEYTSVENFFHNEKPLVAEEARSWYCREDLVTLRPGREHAWLDAFMERALRMMRCRFIEWVFCSKEIKKKSYQPNEIYYSRARIETAVITIITFMILFLLILPIYLLYRLTEGVQAPHSNAACIGILLVFTLAFSAVISLFTRAQRHEILAASAAYCAVLVVFFGNVGNSVAGLIAHNM